MPIVLAIAFAALSCVHLYACYRKRIRLRIATKPCLLVMLAALYILYAPSFQWPVLFALLFGLAGDILLIPNGLKVHFVIGAVSFSIGHALYAYTLFCLTGAFSMAHALFVMFAAMLVYATAVILIARQLLPHVREHQLHILLPAYFSLVALVNVGAWLTLAAALSAGKAAQIFAASLLVGGALLFFISDTILSYSLFLRKSRHANFWVMLTYISAQAFLTAGFASYLS